jgi:hypothetical protein
MLNCWQFDSRDRNQFKIILEQLEVICSKILLQKEGTFFKIFYKTHNFLNFCIILEVTFDFDTKSTNKNRNKLETNNINNKKPYYENVFSTSETIAKNLSSNNETILDYLLISSEDSPDSESSSSNDCSQLLNNIKQNN